MTTLVDRLNLVGCTHPCEQTLKWVLAVALMAHYDELPTPKIIAQKLDELKEVVVVERKPSNHTHITEFPVSPHDLPLMFMRMHILKGHQSQLNLRVPCLLLKPQSL